VVATTVFLDAFLACGAALYLRANYCVSINMELGGKSRAKRIPRLPLVLADEAHDCIITKIAQSYAAHHWTVNLYRSWKHGALLKLQTTVQLALQIVQSRGHPGAVVEYSAWQFGAKQRIETLLLARH